MIQGICGRTFIASSVPAGPLSSWESRLRERLATVGSTESALIWREKITPQGQSISRLAPSMRHTNGTDCTGSPWQTPLASDVRKQSENPETTLRRRDKSQMIGLNAHMALIAYSAMPRASCGGSDPTTRKTGKSVQTIITSYNPTPTDKGNYNVKGLSPTSGDGLCTVMTRHLMAVGGPTPDGSSAPSTARRGAPNPAFPFWLMGFPDEWTSGALAAMRSRQSSRRKSSQPRANRSISERS